jgi:hypothetical protein
MVWVPPEGAILLLQRSDETLCVAWWIYRHTLTTLTAIIAAARLELYRTQAFPSIIIKGKTDAPPHCADLNPGFDGRH